jgi:hypothetical protein
LVTGQAAVIIITTVKIVVIGGLKINE